LPRFANQFATGVATQVFGFASNPEGSNPCARFQENYRGTPVYSATDFADEAARPHEDSPTDTAATEHLEELPVTIQDQMTRAGQKASLAISQLPGDAITWSNLTEPPETHRVLHS
jgi:hypothetical protein